MTPLAMPSSSAFFWAPADLPQGPLVGTGITFQEALAANNPANQRMFAFYELGMFGRQQASIYSETAIREGGITRRTEIQSPIAPTDARPDELSGSARAGNMAQRPETSESVDRQACYPPKAWGDVDATSKYAEVTKVKVTMVELGAYNMPVSCDVIGASATAPTFVPEQPYHADIAMPRREAITPDGEQKPTQASLELYSTSNDVPSSQTAMPKYIHATETWLSLNMASNFVDIIIRENSFTDADAAAVRENIEKMLSEYGFNLSRLTINGARFAG